MRKRLEVSLLTQENFKQFGTVITNKDKVPDTKDNNFNWWGRLGVFSGVDNISINILEAKKRDLKITKLEYHKKTQEAIIPLCNERVIVVVAPAGKLDESKMKAFCLSSKEGIILNIGVRHFIPYPIKRNVDCLIIFRDNTGANDLIYEQLSESYEICYK